MLLLVAKLFLLWLIEPCLCRELGLLVCYHRSPAQNPPIPTSPTGDVSSDARGWAGAYPSTTACICLFPGLPDSLHWCTGRILLSVSHQLLREQWPHSAPASLSSEADGFKLSFGSTVPDQGTQNLRDQDAGASSLPCMEKRKTPECSKPARETVSEQQRAFHSGGDTAPRVSAAACLLQVFG